VRHNYPVIGARSRAIVLSFLFGIAFTACTRRSSAPAELPSGRFLTPDVPVTAPQRKSLSEELEVQLIESFQPIFRESLTQANVSTKSLSGEQLQRLARAMAVSFASDISGRVQRSSSTHCVASPEKTLAYLSCLVFEVVEDNLLSVKDAHRWLSGFSRLKDKSSGQMFFTHDETQDFSSFVSPVLVRIFSDNTTIENMLLKLNRSVDGAMRALEILSSRQASLDMPYLSDSFVKDRRYVLTTSLQQGSVGNDRVYNLESMIVRFQVNSNRLVILREGEGLYSGSSQEDLVVGAYPVVRTVHPDGQNETFYQVDFSRPENKSFLVSAIGSDEASLQLSADVVVPRIVHAAKPVLGSMSNGLYFTQKDQNLVIDQLVLINANSPILGNDPAPSENAAPSKDAIRPTVHVVQGFFPLPSGSDSFEQKQALPLGVSQQLLRANGVKDLTDGKDVPYFATRGFFESEGGRARTAVPYVRKFNLEKEITFVLSRNVPTPMVPVLKSAVLSYKELFDGLTAKNQPSPVMRVFTQDEFEQAHREQGLALGGPVIAADPRVNMIYWDDSFSLGSAWATAVENPKTGEIISGDVMLSGSMWAMEGCKGYFQRTWMKDKEPKLPNRPAGTVPSPISRFLWDAKCDAALSQLGIFKPRSTASSSPLPNPQSRPSALNEFDRANRTGDLVVLAQHASELLGRPVAAAEMVAQHAAVNEQNPALSRQSQETLEREFARITKERGSYNADVQLRVSEAESMMANGSAIHFVQAMKSGRNIVRAKLDCVRHALPNADINLSESGAPRIDSPFVSSPETGAMALVRSVVIHELGHIFGLRHNFIASTTPTVFEEQTQLPVPVDTGTDSIMDYNDYGIEITAGAMRDFSSELGASGLGVFGAYDVVALATAYGLQTESLKFKVGPSFCTDRNVSTFGNCQRFDFGKDYNEYLVHRINLLMQRLRFANPLDAILDPRLPGVYAQLISTATQELLKLNALWGIAQSALPETRDAATRDALLQTAELAFRGQGAKQDFLKNFESQFGAPPLGTLGALQLPSSYFANPIFGELISSLIRKEMDLNMLAVTKALQSRAKSKSSDAAYLGFVYNVSEQGKSYPYLDELIRHFALRVVVPKGSPTSFEYLYDGQRRDGSDATLDGQPFRLNLAHPFFNHQAQILAVPNIVLDGPAPGSRKTVTALVKGRHTIDEMVRAISVLSALSGENPLHPAQTRLAEQGVSLQQLLGTRGCEPATQDNLALAGACETLNVDARAPATIILNSILGSVQGALPTENVASGETF
jgi:hypothetical protein